MPLSYRNILDVNQMWNAIGGTQSDQITKINKNDVRYVKGYDSKSLMDLANDLGLNSDLFNQIFGIDNKKLDDYDPYHIKDAKKEEFERDSEGKNLDAWAVQSKYAPDTNKFKRNLFEEFDLRQFDFWYEDPLYLGFKLSFDDDSPLFSEASAINRTVFFEDPLTPQHNFVSSEVKKNSLHSFIRKYGNIEDISSREEILIEFRNVLFKIFNKSVQSDNLNKVYYVNKIEGLQNLNKKIIDYGEDKISITLNEDVSMISWYIAELYNNLSYSYKNQRYMFPENLLRFNLNIEVEDIRQFVIPTEYSDGDIENKNKFESDNNIVNKRSKKSKIVYTLHDCTFNFFDSYNFPEAMTMAGINADLPQHSELKFDIIYKSVTRWTDYPLITKQGKSINAWENILSQKSYEQQYYDNIKRAQEEAPDSKNYGVQQLQKLGQTVSNTAFDYLDSLETRLREKRGDFVNSALASLRDLSGINKIEPDNVYSPDFNNRASIRNFGKSLASDITNDIEDTLRGAANF